MLNKALKTIETTQEYFKLSIDELLKVKNEYGYTKEECLLFDSGLEVVFFDGLEEIKNEKQEFEKYIQSKEYDIRAILKTINERFAIVLN